MRMKNWLVFIPCILGPVASTAGESALPTRFADTNLYDVVEYAGGFDLGMTQKRPHTNSALRGTNVVCLATVPCREYPRAWVLCDVSADPKLDPFFVLRLQRYVSGPNDAYLGRSYDAVADAFVDLKGKTGRQLVEVPLRTGEIADIVRTDKRGDFAQIGKELRGIGLDRYLDLELLSRTYTERNGFGDPRFDVDPAFRSGVRVYAVALEKPSAELEPEWIEPGNVFHDDEKPETRMLVDVKRPADHRLAWTVTDVDGNVVGRGERKIVASGKVTVDLAQEEPGWYGLFWELFDGDRRLLTHTASFALLGKDTRKSAQGEAPYGCGCGMYQAHYLLDPKTQQETAGKLMLKLGMRRTPGIDTFLGMDQKVKDKYKLAGASAAELWPDQGDRPEEMKKMLDKRLKASPTSKNVIVLYESSPEPYRQAEEVTGGVHEPTNGMKGAEKRVKGVKKVCEFLRKNYPDVKITLGNSLVCSELIAEQMRAGLPKELADYMGSETVQRNNLPELMASSSIQTVDCYRELAKIYGYPWGVNSCQEHCYRLDTLIGEDKQAWWYVRDLVLMQCWRFPDIFLANTVDSGNHYTDSFWGNSGVNRRAPYLYPKKSYVALATATKVLDQVVSRRHVPTGDDCVHVVEFAKKDGSYATALWAVRGEAELDLELSVPCERVSLYGVGEKVPAGKARQKVGEKMTYLVSPSPCVRAAVCRPRRFANPRENDYHTLVRLNSSKACQLGEGAFGPLERKPGSFPCRHAGKGVLTCVKDEEFSGNVLELELTPMNETYPALVSEYATCFLKRPVQLAGAPATLVAWVKGNSGWGEFSFILRDKKGLYRVNADAEWGDMEFEGLMAMNYSGWKALQFPLNARSHVKELSSGDIGNLWTGGTLPDDGSLELVGFAFDAHRRPLFLDERREKRQMIRIGEIGACDYRTDFENEHVAMTFDGTGRLASLREKTGGRELVARPLPFVEVRDGKGARIVPTGLSVDGDRLRFSFPKGSCTLRLVPFKGGWTIETEAFDVPDAQRFVFGQVAPSCDRQMGWQSNAVVDGRSGVVLDRKSVV